jgi:hypothetical protein
MENQAGSGPPWKTILVAVFMAYCAAVCLQLPLSCNKNVTARVTSIGEFESGYVPRSEGDPDYWEYRHVTAAVSAKDGKPYQSAQEWEVTFSGIGCTRTPADQGFWDVPLRDTSFSLRVGQPVELTCHRSVLGTFFHPFIEWTCEWWCYGVGQ